MPLQNLSFGILFKTHATMEIIVQNTIEVLHLCRTIQVSSFRNLVIVQNTIQVSRTYGNHCSECYPTLTPLKDSSFGTVQDLRLFGIRTLEYPPNFTFVEFVIQNIIHSASMEFIVWNTIQILRFYRIHRLEYYLRIVTLQNS